MPPSSAVRPGDGHGGAPLTLTAPRVAMEGVGIGRGASTLLSDIGFTAFPGELVAIVGASGCGKSTLLGTMAGTTPPSEGRVLVEGTDAHRLTATERRTVAFVPQDDVLSEDLPLARMIDYTARLRGVAGSRPVRQQLVADTLASVGLTEAGGTLVRNLSGGERRRASIALELVTAPDLCLLDEPTSGLDPTTAASVVERLRSLANDGRTVIFVTHNANDLRRCDRIVALAPGGRLLFDGTPGEAMVRTETNDAEAVHRALVNGTIAPAAPTHPTAPTHPVAPTQPAASGGSVAAPVGPRASTVSLARRVGSGLRQWRTLTTRTAETIVRNPLTMAIMVGSPVMVIAMFAVLFRPGVFDPASPSPTAAIMVAFWVAFGAFFFGLTYGLLQITPEVPLMRRERRSGVSPGIQVLAKLTALTPVLIAINLAMLAVLVALDRLPGLSWSTSASVAITLGLDAVAALALGLLASALVRSTAQAALALPMLCFPAVLFSGAVLPVAVMAPVGRAVSAVMSDRWAFELIGRDLGLRPLFASDPSPLGPSLLAEFGDAWTYDHGTVWSLLAAFALVASVGAWLALDRRCRAGEREVS